MKIGRNNVGAWLLAGMLLLGQAAAWPSVAAAADNAATLTTPTTPTTSTTPTTPNTLTGDAELTDIQNHWAADTIRWAVSQGIVDGYEDHTFRPDRQVTEAEFLAMLLRAMPDAKLPEGGADTGWSDPYYAYATGRHWPVFPAEAGDVCLRGKVAIILAASLGRTLDTDAAVQYLLDHGLAEGKTANNAEGFAPNDPLTRAEALRFIQNVVTAEQKQQTAPDKAPEQSRGPVQVNGIALGDSESGVIAKFGEPARKDASEYGFQWYIYNRDYHHYAQIGIQNGKVVALFANTAPWTSDKGISSASTEKDVTQAYGDPLEYILKGNTRFMQSGAKLHNAAYLLDGGYVTFFFDSFRNDAVTGVQVVAQPVEESLTDFYGPPSDALRLSFEREAFDLATVSRVSLGKKPFVWDDRLAETARKHSDDMIANNYFEHNDLQGHTPFERMQADGLQYRTAAENIAAGTTSAIFTHAGWMNSEGHRVNILADIERLGVGVSFGGDMHIYYTEDFYTPKR